MTEKDKVNDLIQKHILYRDSYKIIESAGTKLYQRGDKKYTWSGFCGNTARHLDKTTNKIIKLIMYGG